jgi:hypothetical protein
MYTNKQMSLIKSDPILLLSSTTANNMKYSGNNSLGYEPNTFF